MHNEGDFSLKAKGGRAIFSLRTVLRVSLQSITNIGLDR
jgi:hypothetical protein